jgi:hypothetical protein
VATADSSRLQIGLLSMLLRVRSGQRMKGNWSTAANGGCLTSVLQPKAGRRMRNGRTDHAATNSSILPALPLPPRTRKCWCGYAGPSHTLLPKHRFQGDRVSRPRLSPLSRQHWAELCQPRPAPNVSQRRDHGTCTHIDWVQVVNACLTCLLIFYLC